MRFSLSHDQFRRLVDAVVWAIPIDDYAVDSPTNHVGDLPMDLRRVRGVVAHVHMVRASEPEQQVGIDLSGRAGIEQRVHVDVAHIAGAAISIALRGKTVGRARVIGRLDGQGRGRHNVFSRRCNAGHG